MYIFKHRSHVLDNLQCIWSVAKPEACIDRRLAVDQGELRATFPRIGKEFQSLFPFAAFCETVLSPHGLVKNTKPTRNK